MVFLWSKLPCRTRVPGPLSCVVFHPRLDSYQLKKQNGLHLEVRASPTVLETLKYDFGPVNWSSITEAMGSRHKKQPNEVEGKRGRELGRELGYIKHLVFPPPPITVALRLPTFPFWSPSLLSYPWELREIQNAISMVYHSLFYFSEFPSLTSQKPSRETCGRESCFFEDGSLLYLWQNKMSS